VIQATDEDLYATRDPHDYVVGPLLESKLFSAVVVAAPHRTQPTAAGTSLEKARALWGIPVHRGSKWSVLDRITSSVNEAGFSHPETVVVRVLLRAFFIDLKMVQQLINQIQQGFYYVSIGGSIDHALLADVCSFGALAKVLIHLDRRGLIEQPTNSTRGVLWEKNQPSSRRTILTDILLLAGSNRTDPGQV